MRETILDPNRPSKPLKGDVDIHIWGKDGDDGVRFDVKGNAIEVLTCICLAQSAAISRYLEVPYPDAMRMCYCQLRETLYYFKGEEEGDNE